MFSVYSPNQCVFREDLNEEIGVEYLPVWGRLFLTVAAWFEKDLCPFAFVLEEGILNNRPTSDYRELVMVISCRPKQEDWEHIFKNMENTCLQNFIENTYLRTNSSQHTRFAWFTRESKSSEKERQDNTSNPPPPQGNEIEWERETETETETERQSPKALRALEILLISMSTTQTVEEKRRRKKHTKKLQLSVSLSRQRCGLQNIS